MVASIAVLVACSLVAVNGNVPDWEASTLELINGWPDWLEPVLWLLQQAGLLVAPIAVGLVIVALTRRWQYLIPFVLVLPLKLILEKGLVKQLVERERPFVSVGSDINVRGTAFEGLSFPSGHATTAVRGRRPGLGLPSGPLAPRPGPLGSRRRHRPPLLRRTQRARRRRRRGTG